MSTAAQTCARNNTAPDTQQSGEKSTCDRQRTGRRTVDVATLPTSVILMTTAQTLMLDWNAQKEKLSAGSQNELKTKQNRF